MSLKAFHIVFISASILLALGIGAWALDAYFTGAGGSTHLVAGLACLGAGCGLGVYGVYFLKKLKHISYL